MELGIKAWIKMVLLTIYRVFILLWMIGSKAYKSEGSIYNTFMVMTILNLIFHNLNFKALSKTRVWSLFWNLFCILGIHLIITFKASLLLGIKAPGLKEWMTSSAIGVGACAASLAVDLTMRFVNV